MESKTLIKCTALSVLISLPGLVNAQESEQKSWEKHSNPSESLVQSPGQQQRQQGQLMSKKVSDIEGMDVVNAQGEKLGEIDKIVKNKSTESVEAVVSVGGFLGIGSKEITIPIDQLQLQEDQLVLSQTVTEDQLKQKPDYQKDQYSSVEEEQTLAEITGAEIAPGMERQLSFQDLDKDNSGYLTEDEAQTHQQLSDNWQQIDQNADNRIDRAEFSAFEEGQLQMQEQGGGTMQRGQQPQSPESEEGGIMQ